MNQIPPFDSLVAFEAALRLRSMTQAAAELSLTQSAVSHRIRRLEDFMGTPLLLRHNAGLAPTQAGEALIDNLQKLLEDMAGLRARCLSAAGPDRLKLAVGAALAQNWLMRRLPDFAAKHPDIPIELVIVEYETPQQAAQFDVRILWVPVADLRATTTQQPLFPEWVFPVCHPSLLPPDFVPGDASVLAGLPILHKGPAGRSISAEWSWPAWLKRFSLPTSPKESFRFATIGPSIAAAQAGAGVALARSMLVHDALAEGRLVRVLPECYDSPSSKAILVRWRSTLRNDPRVKSLVAWLVAEAKETSRTWREADEMIGLDGAAGRMPAT